ncbi:MAG TPA: hypothetical protein VF211_07045 [Burkholderiales bacterium]
MDLRLAALGLALVAGCATRFDWSKPGATQEAIDADLRACRLAAESIPALPRVRTAPPSGTGSSTTGSELDADTQLERAQRTEACMRSRGYELVAR